MKITLINGSDRHELTHIGESAEVSEALTGEQTITFTVLPEDAEYLTDTTVIEYDGQLYDPARIERSGNALGVFSTVYAEHISYRLNDPAYDWERFTFAGSCTLALTLALAGTELTVGSVPAGRLDPPTYAANATRREILMTLAGLVNCELSYNGYTVNLVSHRGSTSRVDLMATDSVIEVGVSRDLVAGTTAYTVTLGRRGSLSLGDEVKLTYEPLGLDVNTRIIAMRHHPYNPAVCSIDVGDYVPSVLDTYVKTAETASTAAKQAAEAKQTADALTNQLEARVDEYVNSETGKASIVESLHGEFATPADLNGYVQSSVLDTSIGQYIDTQAGTAKIVAACSGTFATQDALGNYVSQTSLSTSIGQYIDGAAGTAKIESVVNGKMSQYAKTSEVSASIQQYINSYAGTAAISSVVSSQMSGYVTTSALASVEQRVGSTEAAISLSATYGSNTIGSNVRALLTLVTNADSSTIKLKADAIQFDGSVYMKSSDFLSPGTTTIKGSKIETSDLYIQQLRTSAGKYILDYSGSTLSMGGTSSSGSFAQFSYIDMMVSSAVRIGYGMVECGFYYESGGFTLRPAGRNNIFNIGSSTYPVGQIRCDSLYVNGTQITGSGSSGSSNNDRIYCGSSTVNYLSLSSTKVLTPSGSGFTIGTTTYPIDTLYVGGTSAYYLNISSASIIPSTTSTTSTYFQLGSSTRPFHSIYAKNIYLNGTALSASDGSSTSSTNFAGKTVQMGGSSTYYIVCDTSRYLRPYSTSTTYPCYLGTSTYFWH